MGIGLGEGVHELSDITATDNGLNDKIYDESKMLNNNKIYELLVENTISERISILKEWFYHQYALRHFKLLTDIMNTNGC